ncbi:MAG: (Fe-S)-binding protein, partial [Pseudomonadota bacterium]
MNLKEIIQATNTYYCLECGKCTSLCPTARFDSTYSPRVVIEEALQGLQHDIIHNKKLFSCLTCGICSLKCPSQVDYPAFIQKARAIAMNVGETGFCAHAGITQSVARLQARSPLPQNRLGWVKPGQYEIAKKSDTMFFVGCAPYFETVFEDIPFRYLDLVESSIKILNRMNIKPLLNPQEKCCGHDALWLGDTDTFELLAIHNAKMIKEAGVKQVVFYCPEGFRTFKKDIPEVTDLGGVEVLHISEVILRAVEKNQLKFGPVSKKITYQDPCRLGRHMRMYDEPRKVLAAIPGLELVEMAHNREEAICCGTSCFTNCDSFSRQVRVSRLQEAKDTKAETLITSCPKC